MTPNAQGPRTTVECHICKSNDGSPGLIERDGRYTHTSFFDCIESLQVRLSAAHAKGRAEGWELGLECSMKAIEPWAKSGTDALKIYNAVLDLPDDPPDLIVADVCHMTPEQLRRATQTECRHELINWHGGGKQTCAKCGQPTSFRVDAPHETVTAGTRVHEADAEKCWCQPPPAPDAKGENLDTR